MTPLINIRAALNAVDRKYFVPPRVASEAYEDVPLPIGHGATISQPTTVAFMLEKLDAREAQKVLDVGSGSGWTTALLAHLVGPKGKVIGLELVPQLVRLGQQNIRNFYAIILENNSIDAAASPEIRQAKKGVVGLPEEAPFDRILVSAAAKRVPQELIDQLAPGGVLMIPVGEQPDSSRGHHPQSLVRIHKQKDGNIVREDYPGFVFVPLR